MNLVICFEGTGQGVHGKRTNVSVVYEQCVASGASADEQRCHLENGPGAKFGSYLFGGVAGVGWKVIFARARRWFEENYLSLPPGRDPSTRIFLFGFSRGALLARHFAAWLDRLGHSVEYLGIWDTVDAIPDLEISEDCPANVRRARHAVAEHESRRFFAYVPLRTSPSRHGQVEEELFPGCHSDVGGLYDDDHTLADLACDWVVAPALASGLRMKRESCTPPSVDGLDALRHDSCRLVSNLFGLIPSRLRVFPVTLKRHFDASLLQ